MKKTTQLIIAVITILFWFNFSYADRVDSTIIWNSTWENAWNVIFYSNPDPSSRLNWAYVGTNNQFYWDFWIENVWRATFSHWVSWSEVKLDLSTWKVSWFAWSENAWWIWFNDWTANWPNVTYNLSTWLFSWFAWSENLWWIDMQWIKLDITPPSITNLKAFATNDNKSFTITDSWSIWNWFSTSVENWSNSSQSIYPWKTFYHDFRKAKYYNVTFYDPSWNSTTWLIPVVANIPSTTLSTNNIWNWATATIYNWTFTTSKIADWSDKHVLNLSLRDTYWNIIKPEPWIKSVNISISYNNNVDLNQIWVDKLSPVVSIGNLDLWDAINYGTNDFLLVNGLVWNSSSFYNSSWDYHSEIISYSPTKYWYTYTSSNNDINLSYLRTTVSAIWWNSWIWEITNYDPINIWIKWNLKFLPAIEVSTIDTNPANWQALFDTWIEFNSTITKNTSQNINNFESAYNLDINSMNSLMSFQDIEPISWVSTCNWYNSSTWYQKTWVKCDRGLLWISNILFSSTSGGSTNNVFRAKPKLVTMLLPSFLYSLSSELVYDIWWYKVAYPSFNYSTSWTQWITNNEIHISWIMNKNNKNTIIMSWSSLQWKIIWDLSKNDIKTSLYKNVENITKNWKSGDPKILLKTGWDVTLYNWDYSKNTIIVKWWDVIINWDILKQWWQLNWIVVLKWANWEWWNIWISKDVTKIEAIIYCDWSLISWDKSTNIYYADTSNWATKQLLIFGSVISSNTIWWSSSTPPKCPYWIKPCNGDVAKRYDLNHFRHFNPNIPSNPDLIYPDYPKAPMIINYDNTIQTNPLKVFTINN